MEKTEVHILGHGWLAERIVEEFGTTWSVHSYSRTKQNATEFVHHLLNIGQDALPDWQGKTVIVSLPGDTLQNNLDTIVTSLSNAAKVILISSTSVYPSDEGEYTESSKTRQDHPLTIIESAFLRYTPVTVLRCGGLMGPNRHPGNWFSGKKAQGADSPVNLVHGNDVAQLVAHCIIKTTPIILNAVAPWHPSKEKFYIAMSAELGVPLPQFSKKGSVLRIIGTHHGGLIPYEHSKNLKDHL